MKQKKAVVLQGISNSGKTSTIKLVVEKLKEKYPTASCIPARDTRSEISVIFQNINGKKVGIESMGDEYGRIMRSLDIFVQAECDIIICACHNLGRTVEAINSISQTYKIHFERKYINAPDQQLKGDTELACHLIDLAGL